MLIALCRALAELSTPPLRRVVALSLGLGVLSFALVWIGVALVLDNSAWFGWAPLDWLSGILGGLVAVLLLSWLLFPAIVTMIMGLFLDRVAAAVEARDYPGRAPARRQPIADMARVTVRLMLLTIALNLVALPLYLVPGLNVFVFLGVNGYLFGREYFEVVALRRLDMAAARAVHHRFGGRIFVGGMVIAGLFAVPLVNLLAPVIATAFMVHVFEGLRRFEAQGLTS